MSTVRPDSTDTSLSLRSRWKTVANRYRRSRRCVTTRSVLIVFLWTFLVSFSYYIITYLATYVIPLKLNIQYQNIASVSFPAILYSFYPIAGLLADLKLSRYKIIISSLWMIALGTPPCLIGAGILATIPELELSKMSHFILISLGVLLLCIGLLLLACSAVGFNANIIQFGLDQLHDSTSENHVIFIQWYLWIFYLVIFIVNVTFLSINFQYLNTYYFVMASIFTTIAIATIFSLYIANRNKHRFVINPRVASNPCKLIHRVSRFAYQHKSPVRRSAFTYSDDVKPSRLDFAKIKYGGPFTTEEVEDVKVFYGITKILLCVGPLFFLEVAAKPVSAVFKLHALSGYYYHHFNAPSFTNKIQFYLIEGSLLYTAEVVLLYPMYIFLLRPFISYYIPRVLIRMGIGLLTMVISLLVYFGMDIFAHAHDKETKCMFSTNINTIERDNYSQINFSSSLHNSKTFYAMVVLQVALITFIHIMMLSSIYEFIFAQSPQAMKGLFMGLFFAVQGMFRALGSLVLLLFVLYGSHLTLPSCGTIYYAANVLVGIFSLVIYVYQAKKYKYRKRDECCNYYYFAEEYYSKVIEEDEKRYIKQ